MIETISTKLLDILAADARLYAGGNAYPAGWPGVKRNDAAVANYVNLFDKSYDLDGTGHRPAVYVGTRAVEATDSLDFPVISAGGRIEYRVLLIPLVVCVQGATKSDIRKQRNQLRRNIKVILLEHIVASGYWYEMTMPGGNAGMSSERVWTTGSGGNAQQVAEGMAAIPCQVRYSWNSSCDA